MSNKRSSILGPLVMLLLLGSAPVSWANSASIVVNPDSPSPPGQFWYSLHVVGGITFNSGDEIYFSGMSRVTNAFANTCLSVPPFSCQVDADGELGATFANDVSFTSTTATFGFACNCGTSATFSDDQGAPYGTLVIDPPGDAIGMIDWAIIQDGVTTYSGTVEGPVASTPEPGTISLTLLGLGLLMAMRKRVTRCLPHSN